MEIDDSSVEKKMTCLCGLNREGTKIALGYDNGDLHIVCNDDGQKSLVFTLFPNEELIWMNCFSDKRQ